MNAKHDHHLVNPSPWPLVVSLAVLITFFGAAGFIHKWSYSIWVLLFGASTLVLSLGFWWKDIIHEAIAEKAHTDIVKKGLRIGMVILILSEVMFFFAFFWSFFKAWLDPVFIFEDFNIVKRLSWPPTGIKPVDPWSIPFMNTLILLLSGSTITWSHYSMISGDKKTMIKMLGFTIILGLAFTITQGLEYLHTSFSFKEEGFKSIYSSNFYMATGFHGLHVILGNIFLIVCFIRAKKNQFSTKDHLGFEFATWYWHFVDVIWLFLFVFVYWLSK